LIFAVGRFYHATDLETIAIGTYLVLFQALKNGYPVSVTPASQRRHSFVTVDP